MPKEIVSTADANAPKASAGELKATLIWLDNIDSNSSEDKEIVKNKVEVALRRAISNTRERKVGHSQKQQAVVKRTSGLVEEFAGSA